MTPNQEINVVKRCGESTPLDLDKIHKMVQFACEDLAGVSESQVEMNANLQFFDGIQTADIQEILIRSANDLISLENPNYQFVAARLLLFGLKKAVYNGDHPDKNPVLLDHVKRCVERGVYDGSIIEKYNEEEWEELNRFIDHSRDFNFTYAGMSQVCDKYLVQDRSTGEIF